MALIWFEHFDLYGTTLANLLARGYTSTGGASHLIATPGRTGTHSLRNGQTGSSVLLTRTFPFTRSVMGMGVAINNLASGTAVTITSAESTGIQFGISGTTQHIRIALNAVGGFSVYQNTTLIGTSAPNLWTYGSYFWLEAKVTAGAAGAGSVEVRRNGETVLNITGLTISATLNSATLGQGGGPTANSSALAYDDWVVWDNTGTDNTDFLGDTFVQVAAPTSDGSPNEWTPSTGTARWDMIDEASPNDLDFITANAVTNTNEFGHANPTLPAGAVVAVAVQGRALKTDAGASNIQIGVASGASGTNMSADNALGTGVAGYTHIVERNPDGNVLWTQAAALAARLRIRRTA